ncbi:MAG TPA: hypothetical protein VKR78_01430 [Acidimicrobiales bacterium]|jgi:bacterioferritin (cytochrome b1)|nr:hypothetical protein [Acidimicrobiales bacterium]
MSTTPINVVPPNPPSPGQERPTWDGEILDQLHGHVESERSLLADYSAAVSSIEDADVRYLMRLILDDEVRHHRMFEELAHALEGLRGWTHVEPSVPDRSTRPLGADVLRLTERFLEAEHEDRRQLKALRRKLAPVADTTLWALLVDLMALDTEKHIRILEAIAHRKAR